MKSKENDVILSPEQQLFISRALSGNNILVDACIGSGKTTAIQRLCSQFSDDIEILYLTYNKLLKLEAKKRIKNKNVSVHNYHGFAFSSLKKAGITVGVSDLIQRFIKEKPIVNHYDVLIIDEYQDIETETAQLLDHVKASNPGIQIIAVGDMEQKICDKTTLNVPEFIEHFLGKHLKLEFTRCFRLSAELASMLGRIWKKSIVGVNTNCIVEEMHKYDVVKFLAEQDPSDILCLGARTGDLADVLNLLETEHPEKFNKKSVYASIADQDATVTPKPNSAIFTTFDSSKGLERKICVVFDFTESYWRVRISKPQQAYAILRNIFCVAASRGKDRIIFVNSGEAMLSEETLSTEIQSDTKFDDVDISKMFDFRYKEDIERCYDLLQIKPCTADPNLSVIGINHYDELIDLSPCIGIYQEAVFFSNYNIDRDIELWLLLNPDKKYLIDANVFELPLDEKILFLVALETKQNRYNAQVDTPFVNNDERAQIVERLGTLFIPEEDVQVSCSIKFAEKENGTALFSARGIADVVKNQTVYELKFVSELNHEHFLQCACYVVALGLKKGILWNTRNNEQYEITIPNTKAFLDAVVQTVTKSYLKEYYPIDKPTKENNIWKNLRSLIRKPTGKTK